MYVFIIGVLKGISIHDTYSSMHAYLGMEQLNGILDLVRVSTNFFAFGGSIREDQKMHILPELHDIFLKVALHFESCAIYLTKLNALLKVA